MLLRLFPITLGRSLGRESISLETATLGYRRFALVLVSFSIGMICAAFELVRDESIALIIGAVSIGFAGTILGLVLYRRAERIVQRATRAVYPDTRR